MERKKSDQTTHDLKKKKLPMFKGFTLLKQF